MVADDDRGRLASAGHSDPVSGSPPAAPQDVTFADGALSRAHSGRRSLPAPSARINAGEMDKVVLARDLAVDARSAIDPRWLLQRLAERYDNTWVFAVDGLVGATPEMLVKLEKGLVTSRVLAGTIRRTGDDEHDLALAASWPGPPRTSRSTSTPFAPWPRPWHRTVRRSTFPSRRSSCTCPTSCIWRRMSPVS